MTHPSNPPAPMTAERLEEIRAEIDQGSHKSVPDLFACIAALTARVAELERERDHWLGWAQKYLAWGQELEPKLRDTKAKLETARRDALEEAAKIAEAPSGINRFRENARGRTIARYIRHRALQTKDTTT